MNITEFSNENKVKCNIWSSYVQNVSIHVLAAALQLSITDAMQPF